MTFDVDHYWVVTWAECFDLTQTPQPTVGQLSDDLDSVLRMLSEEDVAVWHDLEHLNGVLRGVAVAVVT